MASGERFSFGYTLHDRERAEPGIRGGAQQTQRILTTLLGDYWFWRDEHLPSAALVDLLAEFDIGEPAARAAIRRAAARGLVVASRSGRTTSYGVPARTTDLILEHLTRLMDFGSGARVWDGQWTFAMFSVPEDQRQDRRLLRGKLRFLGFAPLYDGVWVSPWDRRDEITEALVHLGVASATVVRAEVSPAALPGGQPLLAWDLDALSESYTLFVEQYTPLRKRVAAGEVGGSDALTSRTSLMSDWLVFPDIDPDLPARVLPAGWPRDEARACFVEIYDALGPVAEHRFRQLVAVHSAELATLASHRTSRDVRKH
jgi:phenylacetic acid degradation operon negative regulatory protein